MAREMKVYGAGGKHRRERSPDPAGFDYTAAAELFLARTKSTARRPKYKRFDTAAEGVRFVVEDLPAAVCPGAYLLVDEARFGVEEIRDLYESAGYPLPRGIEKC
jgi:hypothetical protein